MNHKTLHRRDAILGLGGLAITLSLGCTGSQATTPQPQHKTATPPEAPSPIIERAEQPAPTAPGAARVALIKTDDRAQGVKRAIALLGLGSIANRTTFIKPNFNSADDAPGSTHEETLLAIIEALRELNAGPITIGDRSGMGDTREVMTHKKIFALAKKHELNTLVFDELNAKDWIKANPTGSQWKQGFYLPKPFMDAQFKVMTCCLKTHQYGGHFTMALKNSVGLVARTIPGKSYNYMRELHRSPIQRSLITQINMAYEPDLVILDGVEAFVDGGPHQGDRARGSIIMASTSRVALDILGVAMLRRLGTNKDVSKGSIFEQEQLKQALALGLGPKRAQDIELLSDDPDSAALAQALVASVKAL